MTSSWLHDVSFMQISLLSEFVRRYFLSLAFRNFMTAISTSPRNSVNNFIVLFVVFPIGVRTSADRGTVAFIQSTSFSTCRAFGFWYCHYCGKENYQRNNNYNKPLARIPVWQKMCQLTRFTHEDQGCSNCQYNDNHCYKFYQPNHFCSKPSFLSGLVKTSQPMFCSPPCFLLHQTCLGA